MPQAMAFYHPMAARAPLWLVVGGNLAVLLVVSSIALMLLPHNFVAKSKVLRKCRSEVLKSCRRMLHIWRISPLYRVAVLLGHRCFLGRLSSRCRTPEALKASAYGCSEISVTFTPRFPAVNAFHQECYVVATRASPSSEESLEASWQERELTKEDVEIRGNGKILKAYVNKLPAHTSLQVRICAMNCWGRGPWSEEARVVTLARPQEGGFTGPLGQAAACLEGRKHYRWTQKRGDITLKVPIGEDWPGRDIQVKVTPTRIEILHAPCSRRPEPARGVEASPPPPEQVLLSGCFPKRVKVDEVFWEVEESEQDGRHVALQMAKAEEMDKWPCLVEGDQHPRIDVRLVRIYTKDMEALGRGGIDIFE